MRLRRIAYIAKEIVRHPVGALRVVLFISAMLTFAAFWKSKGFLQLLLFPFAIAALPIIAVSCRLKRRAL